MTRWIPIRRRLEARRRAEQTSQASAVAATAHMDAVPASADDYWHDLRRGRRWVYGGLLRFISRCAALGTPIEVVLTAIDALRWFTHDIYDLEPSPPAMPALRLAA